MRVGVIRGDLPGPILLSDLEPVSRYNAPTEPRGQEIYISRPTTGELEAVLADATSGAGAVLNGANISGSFPLTLTLGVDDTLRLKTDAAAAFGVYVIAAGAYADLTALLAAINTALSGSGITARQNVAGNGVALESNTRGVTSYIENDTVANGSTANTPLGLVDGSVRTMVSAATLILAALPVGGPLDVSTATLNGAGAGTAAAALSLIPASRGTTTAVADAIAPRFWESMTAVDSFLVGYLSDLLNANFNPDPRRLPPLVSGPAITVVQDDGVTLFAATLPTVATADLDTPNPGDLTITGTGLGSGERLETEVHLAGVVNKTLKQKFIEAAGGSVTSTSILIPASMIPGATLATTSAQVKVRQRVSGITALT